LCQELGVVLRALTVVAATRILGWQMTDGIPTPAAGCQLLAMGAIPPVATAPEVAIRPREESLALD
jgi:hypothetical protein